MSCIITYKGNKYTQEQFKEYILNNKNEFSHIIASNKNVINSFKKRMEDIDFVFSQSPELASVGSKAQYLQYLSTIFKTSKVKDIVYHGTETKFDKFDLAFEGSNEKGGRGKGLNFTRDLEDTDLYGNIKIAVLLNAQNRVQTDAEAKKDLLSYIDDIDELVVYNSEQIHILSSKKDLEMFKNFINFTKSEYAKYGDIQQFRDYIMSKNFAAVEEFLVVNNKIDRKC